MSCCGDPPAVARRHGCCVRSHRVGLRGQPKYLGGCEGRSLQGRAHDAGRGARGQAGLQVQPCASGRGQRPGGGRVERGAMATLPTQLEREAKNGAHHEPRSWPGAAIGTWVRSGFTLTYKAKAWGRRFSRHSSRPSTSSGHPHTSRPNVDRNVVLYEKFGFSVIGHADINGVNNRFMWRPARASGC